MVQPFVADLMIPSATSVPSLSTELEGLVQQIQAGSGVITEEVAKGPPVNVARVNAEMVKITHLRNQAFAYFQKLSQLQREATERQRQLDGGRGILPLEWQHLSTRAGHVRVWLNLWPNVQSVLREVLAQKRRKLIRASEPHGSVRHVQTDVVDQLFRRIGGVLNPRAQSDEARELGCYHDISYPMTSFVEHMHAAYRVLLAMGRTQGLSFLDVGCGGGIKVFAAQGFFDQCTGLEFDRNFAGSARKLLRESAQGGGKIIRADAINYRKYSEYDVVFMFRPMSDGDKLSRLEQQVIDNTRPRTLIVAPYKSFSVRASANRCPCIAGSLYLAKSPKSEAVRLRRRAEYIGLSVGQHQSGFPGFFDSILDAAAKNGFRLEERNSLLNV